MSGFTRREFVRQSAVWGLGLGLAGGLSRKAFAANDRISVACIGVRGRDNAVMQSFAGEPDCEITHICDGRPPAAETTRRHPSSPGGS
ncbi:MAG: twin-arginine translocation signal domain-containing protein, partial [Planctomycetes bacterium]|nr:twin-arginine translocation signal domain-containing protein [Planctomycetota bacterium]